jgi:hypothetical protein
MQKPTRNNYSKKLVTKFGLLAKSTEIMKKQRSAEKII